VRVVDSARHGSRAGVRGFALALAAAGLASGCGGSSAGSGSPPPSQHFVSRPDLRPVPVAVRTVAHGTAPGYVFVAPKKDVAQAGPLILDDRGQVIWFDPLETHGVTDFRVQTYRGKRVLTWWQGQSDQGVGNGHYVIMDRHYRQIATVRAGNGLHGDIHEFLITPGNTALITVYHEVPYDLSPWGGAKQGALNEGVVQEIDITTGRVLFEWHSADDVDPSESYEPYEPLPKDTSMAWDYFHINSIDPDGPGRMLVSARNTHSVYEIRKSDGKILWRLGGKQSDFTLGPGTRFAWQHDARRQPDGTITLFDNAASDPGRATSKVLVLRVDEPRRAVTLVRSYDHSPPLLSTSQGNAQLLPDGHLFVGWGSKPFVTEYDQGGDVLLDLRFGVGRVDSYRAFRFDWTGQPTTRPAVALRPAGDRTTVHASWNGATEVASWRILAGPDPSRLSPVATVAKDGFETHVTVNSTAATFAVEALAADRTILRRSAPVDR
jgi:Arylsulfotransferase (ASST)